MSLHLRKLMEQTIADSKSRTVFCSVEKYEEWILDDMLREDTHSALGSLTVICADLLEMVRRQDPAYGLVALDMSRVDQGQDDSDG